MRTNVSGEVTRLLEAIRSSDTATAQAAEARLHQIIYDKLRDCAHNLLHKERRDHSWQTTDLVHEAYAQRRVVNILAKSEDHKSLMGLLGHCMKQLLLDHGRKRNAAKRGGDWQRQPLDDLVDSLEARIGNGNLFALHDALDTLKTRQPLAGQVIELRFFGGFTMEEIAAELNVSLSTVEREHRKARAWLHRKLKGDSE